MIEILLIIDCVLLLGLIIYSVYSREKLIADLKSSIEDNKVFLKKILKNIEVK